MMEHDDKSEAKSGSKKIKIELDVSSMWKIAAAVFAVLFLMAAYDMSVFGDDVNGAAIAPAPSPAADNAAPEVQQKIEDSIDDDDVLGENDAPVTIIEFSDYQCPFCSRFYTDTFLDIKENYIDTGKVRFVHRDLPLAFHADAQKAAEASECAGEQGKFWEMNEILYENNQALGIDDLKGYAEELGLDTGEFNDCLDNGDMEDEVKGDLDDARDATATGTPTFFINGFKLVGAQPYSAFEEVIDAELEAA